MEIKYNMNYDYWIKRYANLGGKRTVGRSSMSDKQYYDFLKKTTPILKEVLNKHCEPTSVLDFGCGIGRWIPILEDFFDKYIGVDIVEEPIIQCKRDFSSSNIVLMKDYTIPGEKESFSNIWTYVTLQHVIDLDLLNDYIHQFYKLLNKNGICIITENCSGNRTNKYMSFRPPQTYIDIFKRNGFTLDAQYRKIRNHAILVFSKKNNNRS